MEYFDKTNDIVRQHFELKMICEEIKKGSEYVYNPL